MLKDGIEKRVEYHRTVTLAVRSAIKELGLKLSAEDAYASKTVTAFETYPAEPKKVRRIMKKIFGVEVAGGKGSMAEKVVRIGHMGIVTQNDIISTISALEMTLKYLGMDIELGSGVKKAEEIFLRCIS